MALLLQQLFSQLFYNILVAIMDWYDGVLLYIEDVGLNIGSLVPILDAFSQGAADVCLDFALGLIAAKFLKKGFETYISYTDGDADSDPVYMITLLCKAIGTACCFRVIYQYILDVVKGFLNKILEVIGLAALPQAGGLSSWLELPGGENLAALEFWAMSITVSQLLIMILVIVFIVMNFILFFKMCKTGVENMILQIGFPISTVGLLDADKGVFKTYFMSLVKNILTALLQLILMKMALGVFANMLAYPCNMVISGTGVLMFSVAIAIMVTAMTTPKLLAEFLIPSGGGLNMMTLYYGKQMASNIKNLFVKK